MTPTPKAGAWLEASDEREQIEAVTGLPCRVPLRMPTEKSPQPPIDCYLVCPAPSNTVAKLALGLSDDQALVTACVAIGGRGFFSRIDAVHARQPAWDSHIGVLRGAGVHLLLGDEHWPLRESRSARGEDLPWSKVLDAVEAITPLQGNLQL